MSSTSKSGVPKMARLLNDAKIIRGHENQVRLDRVFIVQNNIHRGQEQAAQFVLFHE